MDLMDWDGCSEIWVRNWEDWEQFYKVKVNMFVSEGMSDFPVVVS